MQRVMPDLAITNHMNYEAILQVSSCPLYKSMTKQHRLWDSMHTATSMPPKSCCSSSQGKSGQSGVWSA